MPPATPKFALAPEGVPVIQPPPVRKSQAEEGLVTVPGVPQVIPAEAEANTTSTPASASITCKALTVIVELVAICSLMISQPPSARKTNWFAAPLAATAWPLMARPVIWTSPLTVAPIAAQAAAACDSRKSAVIVVAAPKKPPPVKLTLATEASEDDWL